MSNQSVVACAVSLLLAATPVASFAAADACAALTSFQLVGSTAVVQKAAQVAAGKPPASPGRPPLDVTLPAHCRVEGVIDARTGRNGRPYAIGFAVAMPAAWNGRFYMQGGGGLNGSLGEPLGTQASGATPALARGFAVVSTDSGHRGSNGFDSTFFEDQEATLNFLYQAVGKVTVVAKEIVTKYYGRAPARSYYVGCSTGGREAMIMSQRYPGYYDGIVAGAPAMRTSYSNLATAYVTTALNGAAPKDAQGKALTDRALSPADRKLVVDGFLKACDALDGTRDGMVFDTRGCRFDPASLVCSGTKNDSCLSPQQAAAIRKGFAGPKTTAGVQVYPGFLYDTGMAATPPPGGFGIPGLLVSGMSPVGPSPTGTDMNVDLAAANALTFQSMAGDSNAWTNLSSFLGHDGKLLFYHGVSDPWFSALDTIGYYERMAADNAPRNVQDYSRLFLVPGMGHCGGGGATLDRFDMVDAIVDWVEKGKAPESVVATGSSFPQRSRPLCAYPRHAQYKGSGNPESAESFSCAE